MSLISDALKKARQEAARQDAQRQRPPYAVGAADLPACRASLLPLLTGLGAGGLLAAVLLFFAWSAGWGPFARPAPKGAQVAAAAPAAPPPAKPAAEPQEAPPAAAPETSPAPPPRPAAPAQETRPQPPPVETRTASPAAPPAASPAPVTPAPAAAKPAPSPPPPTATAPPVPATPAPAVASPAAPVRPSPAAAPQGTGDLVDGRSYTGQVPVPGGGAVKLNGIAFSKDHPIAVLDGRVMEPGEIVQGFTIVAIEDGRVKLQGYGATVFVSPR